MNIKLKKVIALVACLSITGSIFIGCGKKNEAGKESTTASKGGEVQYPISSKTTLKYWVQLNSSVATTAKSLGETEFSKELEKESGIKVEYIHPAQGQQVEKFNLLIASGELPDLVEYDWSTFPGGPEKAIKDGYILKLNDYIDKFAPNFKKYLKDHPDIDKLCKTDSGSYYIVPFIRQDDVQTVFYGPMLRKDWLKDVNMETPTTIEEWEKVLTAFKEKKGAAAPLTYRFVDAFGFVAGAYGVTSDYYLDDNGKVKYGPTEPGYKQYLETLNKWYKDGLLDKNFATIDTKMVDANMLSGKSGATLGYTGGSMGAYLSAQKDKDPKYDLVAAPFPTLKKGEVPQFGQKNFKVTGLGVAVSAKTKDIETALRFLDYGFTPKGEMLYNFGIENVSYKMENNYPKYTDLITKNPEKLSMAQALGKYARSTYNGPFVQRKEYLEQYTQLPQQQEALKTWAKTDAGKHNISYITPTPEEAAEVAKISTDIKTYVDEMTIKFVMGVEPLSNYDKFVEQIKKLNVDKAIQIKQAEVERFSKR